MTRLGCAILLLWASATNAVRRLDFLVSSLRERVMDVAQDEELFRVKDLPFHPAFDASRLPPMYAGLLPIDSVSDAS
eukprot:7639014-Prorocentrum_lima.AAC.1